MADFRLTEEQRQYQQLARDFAQGEVAPRAEHYDRTGEFPMDLYAQAFELGLANVLIPESCGGFGLGVSDACLIAEELGAACSGIAAAFEASGLAQLPLILAGTAEQQKELLEPLAAELSFAAAAVDAFVPGWAQAPQLEARRCGDDYVLNGTRRWVVNGSVARWYLVAAATAGRDERELSLYIVPGDSPGLEVSERRHTMGCRAADVRDLAFKDVSTPARYLVGGEGRGRQILEAAAGRFLPQLAAAAAGLARSALEHSLRYSQERTTFGQPIANHQAVSFMLADMAKDIEAARLLAWQAAWLADQGMRNGREAAAARAFAADTALRASIDAVQIFGGYGYSREYPVEKLMRDAKVLQMLYGTALDMKSAIARDLVGVP